VTENKLLSLTLGDWEEFISFHFIHLYFFISFFIP